MQKNLKVIDDTCSLYLKISSQQKRDFTYYTFDSTQDESWSILGVRYLHKTPFLIDLRLMHIDQDALAWEPFVAERDTPGYILCNSTRYLDIIAFLETLLSGERLSQEKKTDHFSLLNHEELRELHYPPGDSDVLVNMSYRYISGIEGQDAGMVNVIRLPHWSPKYGEHQVSLLWFFHLSQHHLQDPQFALTDDSDGLGTLRFNQRTLEELIFLLKQAVFV